MIDMRSDTVTQPTHEMRKAMANAEVGDDVYGEDPTINRLEKVSAELVGKEAALFVPTGTMGNQIAVLTHTKRGDEVILDEESHIAYYEVGGPAMLASVQLRTVPGLLVNDTLNKIYKAHRQPNIHYPNSSLLCLENTFNRGGGSIMPPAGVKAACEVAKELNLLVHMDGARIFNATVGAGCDVKEFTQYCDSIQFCLSKGLSAPVGSILAGNKEFIAMARKYRKALGGGMRQAGVLAAAGLISLKMIDRLAEDHANAKILAEGLSKIKGIRIDLDRVHTNMVFIETTDTGMDSATFTSKMEEHGVRAIAVETHLVRFVTHKDVTREDVIKAIEVANKVVNSFSQS
ncbi:MAG: threonine aldolase [Desulfitibacter sp. BRH_c19]|nr:MAG: threonine aldolase [Desulfitibacter sp. BRH_c19]